MSLQAKQLHHLRAQLSLGQSCLRPKKKKKVLCLCTQGRFGRVQLCSAVEYGLPDFSIIEGILQARIMVCIGQYWLPYPSGALYFLLP